MAIEDGYQLAVDLTEAVQKAESSGSSVDVEEILKVHPPSPTVCIRATKLLADQACFSCAQPVAVHTPSVS